MSFCVVSTSVMRAFYADCYKALEFGDRPEGLSAQAYVDAYSCVFDIVSDFTLFSESHY